MTTTATTHTLRPDPYIPGHIVHVDVSYSVVLKDQNGNNWVCYYPIDHPDSCQPAPLY